MTYNELRKQITKIRREVDSAFISRNHGAMIDAMDRIAALYESAGSALVGIGNRGKKIAVSAAAIAARRENGKKGGRPRKDNSEKPLSSNARKEKSHKQ